MNKQWLVSFSSLTIAGSLVLATPALAAPPLAHLVPGQVVAVTGTPNLWVADSGGAIHFASDPRALAGHDVDWNGQIALPADEFPSQGIGAPWLSTALVKIGDSIFLPQFEATTSAPTLRRIQSPEDLAQLGITAGNYGQYVLDLGTWQQRYHFSLAQVQFDGDFALTPAPAPAPAPETSSDNPSDSGSGSGDPVTIADNAS
jgi:hypothetical protein